MNNSIKWSVAVLRAVQVLCVLRAVPQQAAPAGEWEGAASLWPSRMEIGERGKEEGERDFQVSSFVFYFVLF